MFVLALMRAGSVSSDPITTSQDRRLIETGQLTDIFEARDAGKTFPRPQKPARACHSLSRA